MKILDHAITAIDKKNGLDNRHWDLAVAVRSILNEPATQSIWTDKGMMVPEDITPAAYRSEIADRIQFYQRIAKANNVVVE